MRSYRHGREYSFGMGQSGGKGPNTGKKATTFICSGPDGTKKLKRVFNADGFVVPVALYYQHNDIWYLNTVVDANDMPDWAANYVQAPAAKRP